MFRQAGNGYSTTIVGGTLYCQGAADDTDFAFALDTETGKLKWKQPLGPMFVQDRGNGLRGAVTVTGDSLYLIRGGGELLRLAVANGKPVWRTPDASAGPLRGSRRAPSPAPRKKKLLSLRNSVSRSSRRRWMSRVPQLKRTEDMP